MTRLTARVATFINAGRREAEKAAARGEAGRRPAMKRWQAKQKARLRREKRLARLKKGIS